MEGRKMGYQLPLVNFTRQNYHYRLLKRKKSPFHITGLYKVNFYRIGGDNEAVKDWYAQINKQKRQKKEDGTIGKKSKSCHQKSNGEQIDVRV